MILKLDDPKLLGDAVDIISNVVVEVRWFGVSGVVRLCYF